MEWLKRIVGKATTTAKAVMTEAVQKDIVSTIAEAGPAVIGAGLLFGGGMLIHNARKPQTKHTSRKSPTIVVTNNYFLDDASKAEVLARLTKQGGF